MVYGTCTGQALFALQNFIMYTRLYIGQESDKISNAGTADQDAGKITSSGGWKCRTITTSANEMPSPRGGCSWTQVGTASS